MSGFTALDHRHMTRALRLARQGWYSASPNPRVGCVIASGETVVGEGFHRKAGEPHAEINALKQAGAQARGATAYVTLEPCNHQGKTGPCARALIEAGVAEVVYGMTDPHVAASGGIATLQGAGIHVRGPLMEAEARTLNPGFIKRCQSGLPRVTVKLAMSLDGRTAMASGESQWITSPAARRDVQRLRAESDAIITGIGTVLRDNPALTIRPAELDLPGADEIARRQPLRVVVDSKLRLPATAKLVKEQGSVLVATCEKSLKGPASKFTDRVAVVACGRGSHVDLKQLLVELGDRHCNDILVEAGAELSGAFMAARLVDRLIVYMAPKLMGSEARPLLALPFAAMAEALELTMTDSRAIGPDWRLTAQVNNKETEQA